MDEVTSRIIGELRTKKRKHKDENENSSDEDTTPFIVVDGSHTSIPYADEDGAVTPVRCDFDPSAFAEEEARDVARRSRVLLSSFQRQGNKFNEDPDGFALLQALIQGNIDELNRWITWHLSRATFKKLRYGRERETALIIASTGCGPGTVDALLSNGVDPDEADWSGRTPLLVASASGKHDCVQALLNGGANPNLGCKHSGGMRTSEALEDIEWHRKEDDYLSEHGIKLPDFDVEGRTPLHLAAHANSLECLKLLLNSKADSNAKDSDGLTPLMLAGEGLDSGDFSDVVTYEGIIRELIEYEAECEGIGEEKMRRTVLHKAAELDAHYALDLLLSKKCDPNWCVNNDSRLTPLHVAAETAVKSCATDPSCTSTLLKYGADISAENAEGLSALEIIVTQVSRPKKFLHSILDSQINLTDEECESGREVRVNFKSVSPVNGSNQEKILHALLEQEFVCRWLRYDLFRHPLLKSFVIRKWTRLRKFFYVYVVVYLIHVLSLSVFVTLAHCDIFHLFGGGWRNSIMQTGIPISKLFVILTSILVFVNISWMCYVFPHRYPFSFEALRNFGGSILSIVVSVLTVYDGDSYAFSSRFSTAKLLDNREEIEPHSVSGEAVVPADSSILELNHTGEIPILTHIGEDSPTSWIESPGTQLLVIHCTALAIFQAWLDLMLLMGRFPWASDALLFTAVLKNVLRVLATYGYMIVGFAFVFFLEFREANIFAFGDPWRALLKTVVMMMGEYEYMETFAEGDKNSAVLVESKIPTYTQVIFLGFVVIASIALMNLMLGLAVSDTQELAEESSQRQLMKLAESVVHWGTAVCALERLCTQCPKVKDWFKRCRTIPDKLTFPLNFKKAVIPRDIMKELSEIATKNQDYKQNQKKDGPPSKNFNAPRKLVSHNSNTSTAPAPKSAAYISKRPEISEDAREVIESLRNEIAELKELHQEVAEIKDLLETYFNGEKRHRPLRRTHQPDSTHKTTRISAFFQRSTRNRRGDILLSEIQHA